MISQQEDEVTLYLFIHTPFPKDRLLKQEWGKPRGKVVHLPVKLSKLSNPRTCTCSSPAKYDFSISVLCHKSKALIQIKCKSYLFYDITVGMFADYMVPRWHRAAVSSPVLPQLPRHCLCNC